MVVATTMPHEYFPTCQISLKNFTRIVKLFNGYNFLQIFYCRRSYNVKSIFLQCRRRAMSTRCKKNFDGRSTKAKKCRTSFFFILHVISGQESLCFGDKNHSNGSQCALFCRPRAGGGSKFEFKPPYWYGRLSVQ